MLALQCHIYGYTQCTQSHLDRLEHKVTTLLMLYNNINQVKEKCLIDVSGGEVGSGR